MGRARWSSTLKGKDYVDGMANLWLCQVGHGRAEIIDAVTTQMRQIEAYNTFAPFTNGPAARVAKDDRGALAPP
ncbi:MAG: hypothetical protein Ct9H300mP12_06830 [Acidimicrobiales bacterium]|nr:MAG: hypothetical protein Ct9H300mP12_06830 [Acidimicrobiales bacterium]